MKEFRIDEIYVKHDVSQTPKPSDFNMHIHEYCEIFLCVRGRIAYLVEGSKYLLPENSVMIMRPAEAHTPSILEEVCYERYAVNFPLSLVQEIDPQGLLLKPFVERPLGKNNFYSERELDMEFMKKLFEEMCSEKENEYEKKLTVTTHIYMMLDRISRAFAQKNTEELAPGSFSEEIIMYIDKHIAEELSVVSLARHFHLSASQFRRIFKQATGAAPWEYITRKRLAMAKEKIRNGSLAQSAAESCGFGDYSSFYRAYTKQFGCSPREGTE